MNATDKEIYVLYANEHIHKIPESIALDPNQCMLIHVLCRGGYFYTKSSATLYISKAYMYPNQVRDDDSFYIVILINPDKETLTLVSLLGIEYKLLSNYHTLSQYINSHYDNSSN